MNNFQHQEEKPSIALERLRPEAFTWQNSPMAHRCPQTYTLLLGLDATVLVHPEILTAAISELRRSLAHLTPAKRFPMGMRGYSTTMTEISFMFLKMMKVYHLLVQLKSELSSTRRTTEDRLRGKTATLYVYDDIDDIDIDFCRSQDFLRRGT